jgi:hypothetical protein
MTRWRPCARAAGALLVATPLAAQTLPVPAFPPSPPPELEGPAAHDGPAGPPRTGAEAFEAPGPPRPRAWEYALGAGAGWDTNIGFLVPDGPRAAALFPHGGVARVFSGTRGRWRAMAAGGWIGYPRERPLDRHQYELGIDGVHRPSPTTTWLGSVSYTGGYSDTSRILLEQGVSLPAVKTRSLAAVLGLRKGRPGAWLRIDARFRRTDFESSTLVDGQSVRGTLGLERRLGRHGTGAVEYSLEDVLADEQGRRYLTHFGSLQWTVFLAPRSALLLEAGASYTPEAARVGLERKESFFGGASFSRQVRRSGFLLFVRREVTPAFGLGVSRLELRAGMSVTIPLGRQWEVRLVGSHVQPDRVRGAVPLYGPSEEGYGSVSRRLGRSFELSAEGRYRRRGGTVVLDPVETMQVGVFVTWLSRGGGELARGMRP